jgi:hypothetical protein
MRPGDLGRPAGGPGTATPPNKDIEAFAGMTLGGQGFGCQPQRAMVMS